MFTARQECGSVCAVGSRWKMSNSSDGRKKSPLHIWILQGESREFPKAGGFFKKKKAGNLQDAGEHKAGGGGGSHTRVWWVSCQLTRQKLSVQPEKMCVSFNFQPKYPKKDNTHSAYSGLDSRQKFYSSWGVRLNRRSERNEIDLTAQRVDEKRSRERA